MTIKISFSEKQRAGADTLVVGVHEGKSPALPDVAEKKAIAAALKRLTSFQGKPGEVLPLNGIESEGYDRIVILGLGKSKELDALKAETAGGKLYAAIKDSGAKSVDLMLDKMDTNLAAHLAMGAALRSYHFDQYKSAKKEKASKLASIAVVCKKAKEATKLYKALDAECGGVFLARNLVNMAPNELYPESYAELVKKELKPLGVSVEIFDEKKLEKLGMGAILAVGMGSARKPRMVVLRYNGLGAKARKDDQPLAFVGKGVTFDTGGISIKPGANMDEMKMDMGGSAAVVGLMKTLAMRKATVDVVGVIGLAENMPSADAYRPGDIVTSYSGKTIEVLNTDAEGRLVLVDCLSYLQEKYTPSMIVDLATLTGAVMVALGHEHCGAFVNDEKLWRGLERASETSGEKLWRLPLDAFWRKDVEGNFGDVMNVAKSGRWGGACSAAAFLEHFVEDGTPWAHLDIAGTALTKSDKPTVPKYGTGFGVRVLNQLVKEQYES